jgi:Pycsar effector protein
MKRDRTVQDGPGSRPIDFAWHVHAAQEAWTAKVDVKASIVLATELAVIGVILAGNQRDQILGRLHGAGRVLVSAGLGAHVVAVVLIGLAVLPRLGRGHPSGDPTDGAIYFGDLRHISPRALTAFLEQLAPADELRQLSRQLIEMSRINWYKHRMLQAGMALAALCAGLVGLGLISGP